MKVFPWFGHHNLEDIPREDFVMSKKIVVSLLSILMLVALTLATINPGSVMAIVGLSSLDANTLEKTQADMIQNLTSGMTDLAKKMGNSTEKTYTSEDGAVVVKVTKGSQDIEVIIEFDGSLFPDIDYKDIGKVMRIAQNYLKPVFTEKQAMGLCGLLIGDAYAQYRREKAIILITKEYEGITIECSGDVDLGLGRVSLKSALGVKKWQPNKSKTTEMKALPL